MNQEGISIWFMRNVEVLAFHCEKLFLATKPTPVTPTNERRITRGSGNQTEAKLLHEIWLLQRQHNNYAFQREIYNNVCVISFVSTFPFSLMEKFSNFCGTSNFNIEMYNATTEGVEWLNFLDDYAFLPILYSSL